MTGEADVPHPAAEVLSALADGEIDDDEMRRAAMHVDDCAVCREEVDGYVRIRRAVRDLAPPAFPNGWEAQIAERVVAADAAGMAVLALRRRAAVVVVGVATVVVTSLWLVPASPRSPRPSDPVLVPSGGNAPAVVVTFADK